jgi:hypothetical protein
VGDRKVTAKTKIVERLGETALLLPAMIGDALAANDRLKLRLTALQEAVAHAQAQAPGRAAPRFSAQPFSGAPADEPTADAIVAQARMIGAKRLVAPGAAVLLTSVARDLDIMLAPIRSLDSDESRALVARAGSLKGLLPSAPDDQLDLAAINGLASADRDGPDSLHLLVMDLHKAINRLAADTFAETLDGAHVHGLTDGDRRAVAAFMRGLHRTAPLAFGHPGLGTMAVRTNGRLTIQNDIGTTDAHVLVMHIEAGAVTVTYTDVHRARAKFFVALFRDRAIVWNSIAEQNADGMTEELFYMVSGRFAADDDMVMQDFLDFLGSRIVFLIDWNKARKALQTFVGRGEAIALLDWAALHDVGHRAFLEIGGADLIFEAVHRVAAGRIPYGVRLDEALGAAACVEFLQHVLRDTSQGLSAGRTARLIRDEIQADLSRRFETAESSVLTVLVRHLGLTRMLAEAIAGDLAGPGAAAPAASRALAQRAKRLEEKGDRLTVAAREILQRIREADALRPVIDEIENTTDALEECAFLVSLAPETAARALRTAPVVRLAQIVIDSVGSLVRAVEAASRLPQGQRADAVASLQSIDAVIEAERAADVAERDAIAAAMAVASSDARALTLGLEVARALETATDHLSHAALSLRDRVLEELSA